MMRGYLYVAAWVAMSTLGAWVALWITRQSKGGRRMSAFDREDAILNASMVFLLWPFFLVVAIPCALYWLLYRRWPWAPDGDGDDA